MLNFSQWLFETHADKLTKPAVVDNHRTLTYGDLEKHVRHFGCKLLDHGIKPEQRIVICADDCVEWPVAFLAALAIGANPVIVNPSLPLSSIQYIIDLSAASLVISDQGLDIKPGPLQITCQENVILDTRGPALRKFYMFHPDERSHWLLTSGSTGEPSCVVHRHLDLFLLKDYHAAAYQVTADTQMLSTSKLPFAWGFHNNMCLGLAQGATLHLINNRVPAPSRIFDKINKYNITHIFLVPAIINALIKHGRGRKLNKSVTTVVSSGEALPRSLRDQFLEMYGVDPLDGIGMAEGFNYCTQTKDMVAPGTCGKPLPGIECELRNADGSQTPDGEVGEMWVKHPAAALQYWNNWEKSKSTFQGPWIKTGDMMIKNSEGNYVHLARVIDLISINGSKISPTEIESCLLANHEIDECAVIAGLDKSGEHEIHAFVVSRTLKKSTQVQDIVSNSLPKQKVPRHVHFVDSLPRTVTGKIGRTVLKQSV